MFRKLFLLAILIVLAYGFWISPDFKHISAGVAIFLFGMISLEEGFKSFSGGLFERILEKSTDKTWKSVIFGMVSTTFMQSSSLVSVLTISFLGAGLIGLAQGIGIVFGANLGTTTGAWLIAGLGLKVKISAYAMPMLVFGVILIFQKSKSLKGIGYILTGLGFLFLGIHYMKEGFEAFKSAIDLSSYSVGGIKGLLIFTGIGIFATVVMQSSHATLVLILTALAAGQINYENGLALAIGANVGTTITAIIGSLSSNIQGKRLAGAHLIFNVITGLIAIVFMQYIMIAVDSFSNFVGIANDNYTLKLAVFHTIFNIIGVIVMLPFINFLVRFLERVLILKVSPESKALYLDQTLIENVPSLAMVAIEKEYNRLYDHTFRLISHSLRLSRESIKSDLSLDEVIKKPYVGDDIDITDESVKSINSLYAQITDYISDARVSMDKEMGNQASNIQFALIDIIRIIDDTKHFQSNVLKYTSIDMAERNEFMYMQYNSFRMDLVDIIRNIEIIRNNRDNNDVIIESLANIQVHAKKNLDRKQEAIHKLSNKLSKIAYVNMDPIMSTALAKDTGYMDAITKNLFNMTKILFVQNREFISEMILSDDEVNEIVKKGEKEDGS
ncbi:MAG: Na/Pi cotransporter family protein [Bacteroidales bacterium]|nr:Na/Pi cotransporter family protein [Bacteroidales bacterium]